MARLRLSRFGRGRSFRTKRRCPAQGRSAHAMTTTEGEPEPGIRPVSRSATRPSDSRQGQRRKPPLAATDHLGVVSKLWPVTDVRPSPPWPRLIGPKPIFIADGHHRYETACKYRDHVSIGRPGAGPSGQLRADDVRWHGGPGPDRAAHAPAVPRPASHDRPRPGRSAWASVSRAGGRQGPDLAPRFGTTSRRRPGHTRPVRQKDQRWLLATLTHAGSRWPKWPRSTAPSGRPGGQHPHRLLIETCWAASDLPKPRYVHLVEEVVEGLRGGRVPALRVGHARHGRHIRTISEHGERMPAKSTYFYPKLLSGLVINPLE